MNIIIDSESPIPIYKQIKNQIKGLIINKNIEQGTVLPSIRLLASILSVANNTIARAYYELEKEGYITLSGRRGSIVNNIENINNDEREKFLIKLTEEYILRSREYAFSKQEIIKTIENVYDSINE